MRPLKNVYPRRRAEMKRRGHVLAASWSSQTDKQTAAPCRWHHDVKLRSPPSAPLGSSSSAAVDIRAPARGGELVCGCVCVCVFVILNTCAGVFTGEECVSSTLSWILQAPLVVARLKPSLSLITAWLEKQLLRAACLVLCDGDGSCMQRASSWESTASFRQGPELTYTEFLWVKPFLLFTEMLVKVPQ